MYKRQGNDTEPDMTVADRYYNRTEYAQLSAAKKMGLKKKRDGRGHTPGGTGKRGRGGQNAKQKSEISQRTVSALLSALVMDDDADAAPDPMETEAEDEPKKKKVKIAMNRYNAALKRKKV